MKILQSLSALALVVVGTILLASGLAQGKGKGNGNGGTGTTNQIVGTDGPDTIYGDPEGVAREDLIDGLGGDDTIYGLLGDDVIHGGGDNDHLYGNEGNDVLNGEGGDDVEIGGDGDDDIWPFPGHDVIDGGPGRDTIRVNTDQMQFLINLKGAVSYDGGGKPIPDTAETVSIPVPTQTPDGDVIDVYYDVPGLTVLDVLNPDSQDPYSDTNTAFAIVANMEHMRGGTAHADYICGSDNTGPGVWTRDSQSGDGEWFGTGRGNDYISAGDGDDFIGADRGDDILIGGLGWDLLHGAENKDLFVFYASDFASNENDMIDDFNLASDAVVLVGLTASPAEARTDGDDGKAKTDWVVTLTDDSTDSDVGTITFWDVNPDGHFIDGDETGWPADFCRP